MVVVFAYTGGLTGAEAGIAGGTRACVGQKLLEAVFGDQAVRRLADRRAQRPRRAGRRAAGRRAGPLRRPAGQRRGRGAEPPSGCGTWPARVDDLRFAGPAEPRPRERERAATARHQRTRRAEPMTSVLDRARRLRGPRLRTSAPGSRGCAGGRGLPRSAGRRARRAGRARWSSGRRRRLRLSGRPHRGRARGSDRLRASPRRSTR